MADFPGSIASDGSLLIAANNVSSTLNGGISAVALAATMASTVHFPAKGGITIETEAILYSGNNTATGVLTLVTRGADSTTAAVHADGVAVYMHNQARHHNAVKDEIIAIETNIGNRFGNTSTGIIVSTGSSVFNAASTFNTATTLNGPTTFNTTTTLNGPSTFNTTATFNGPVTFNTTTTFSAAQTFPGLFQSMTFTSRAVNTSSSSLTFVSTGFSLTLSVVTTTSRVCITSCATVDSQAPATGIFGTIFRGATNLMDSTAGGFFVIGSGSALQVPTTLHYVDTPGTNGSVSYTIYFRSNTTGTAISYGTNKTQVISAYEIRG